MEYLTARQAVDHINNGGRVTIKWRGSVWGCDWYNKNGVAYAYNEQLGPCSHDAGFDTCAHFERMIEAGFKILKSDDLTQQQRHALHAPHASIKIFNMEEY